MTSSSIQFITIATRFNFEYNQKAAAIPAIRVNASALLARQILFADGPCCTDLSLLAKAFPVS
jgi:hypothetical protein